MSEPNNLDSALDAAMDALETENIEASAEEGDAEENESSDAIEDPKPEAKASRKSSDDEFSEEQLQAAKSLYKKLVNPETSVATIQEMVKRAGYTLTEVKEATKAETKEILSDVTDILKEELGDDFDLLSGSKLGAALAKVLDIKVEAALKPLKTKLEAQEAQETKKSVDKALDWAYSKLEGFAENESLIAEKMQVYPYTGKISYEDYLTEMLALATSGAAAKRISRGEQNQRNGATAPRSVKPSATKPVKAITLDEALDQAFAELK